jgi:hypothetical protein
MWSAIPFREPLIAEANARCARSRHASARCAGVVRRPVVQTARCGEGDLVLGVIPMNARYAAWFRAGVVQSCGRQMGTSDQRAEHAHAADRFAREIVGFLEVSPGALAAADGQAVSPQN